MIRVFRLAGTIALAAVVLLSMAACGGQASGGSAASAGPVATTHIDLPKSYKFEPVAIVGTVGATVTWTNSDNFTHSVQLDGDPAPGAVIAPGGSTSHTFDEPGTYAYVCAFHPQNMKGTVVVMTGAGSETP